MIQAQAPNITQVPYLSGFTGSVTGWGAMQGNNAYPNSQHVLFRVGQLGHFVVPLPTATAQQVANTWNSSFELRTAADAIFQEGILDAHPGLSVIQFRCPREEPCNAGNSIPCKLVHVAATNSLACSGVCCLSIGPISAVNIGDCLSFD